MIEAGVFGLLTEKACKICKICKNAMNEDVRMLHGVIFV